MRSQAFQELTLKISQKENAFNIADCGLEGSEVTLTLKLKSTIRNLQSKM